MTRRLRIVHVLPRDGIGGVESAARSMAARTGLPCDFHLLLIAGGTLAPNSPRIETSGFASAADPRAHRAVLSRCLALDPDVVVASLWKSVPLLAALKLRRPRIKRVMTLNSGRDAHFADAVLFRAGVALADEVWSDSAAALAERRVTAPHRVISFVTERLAPLPPAAPQPRFVAWARIDRNKGFDVALDLVAALAGRGLDSRFDLYGPDGGARASLEAQSRRLAIAGRVQFHGPVERADLPAAATGASFFLLPSRLEGMAMACVEAMQLGLVPVVTPVGEMARYVVAGRTGLLIDPTRLDRAAGEIAALIVAPDRFAALGAAAAARWAAAPLYADDVCRAATALARPGAAARTRM